MNISAKRLPYLRMAGYSATIVMHVANTCLMLGNFTEDTLGDPNIQLFSKFIFKFITCWNFVFQTVHAIIGLSCDLLALTAGDQDKSLTHAKQARDLIFAGLVVPYTFVVATCFWPLFLYDRELILPYYTTKIVGTVSNHIMHSAIVPVALWELIFQPRQVPRTHKHNLSLTALVAALYLAVIFKTFFRVGHFPYPLMTMLYGSVSFVAFLAAVITLLPIFYFAQWRVTRTLWSQKTVKKYC